MKVVRKGDVPEEPVGHRPIFVGDVYYTGMIPADVSPAVTVALVRFPDGAKNVAHRHTNDQILYVTEGEGIVADREAEHRVTAGDIVHIPAGEWHWHGAAPGTSMAHLAIMPPGETTIAED